MKPSAFDTIAHVIVSSDSGYRLELNGGSFEASVTAGAAGRLADRRGVPRRTGGALPGGAALLRRDDLDGSTLSLYVNPAASDDEETFLSTRTPGDSRFNSAPTDYQAATSNDLRIGASADGDTPGEFFAGVIQDVAVYDGALGFKDIVSRLRCLRKPILGA